MAAILDSSPAIEQLRAALPWWTSWGAPLGLLLFTFIMTLMYGRLMTFLYRRAHRKHRSSHWTEQARHTWGPRKGAVAAVLFVPAMVIALGAGTLGPLSPLSTRQFLVLSVMCGFIGASITLNFHPPDQSRVRLSRRERMSTVLYAHLNSGLMLPMLLLSILSTQSDPRSPMAWLPALVTLGLFLWLAMGGASSITQRLGLIRPVPGDLGQRIRGVCKDVGVELRGAYTRPFPMCNALALIWTKEIVLLGGIEDLLEPEELDAVIAHEAGHLAERRRTRWSRLLLGSIGMTLPLAFPLTELFGWWGIVALLALILVMSKGSTALSRRMEVEADEKAEGPALAAGLEKIHRSNLVPAVIAKKSSHPSLVDRMRAAGVEPTWPVPHPPPKARGALWIVAFGLMTIIGFVFWTGAMDRSLAKQEGYVPGAIASVGITAGGDSSLIYLGNALQWDGQEALATSAFTAAFDSQPTAWRAAHISRTLSGLDDPKAEEWRQRALDLSEDGPAEMTQAVIDWMDD